MVSKRMMPAPLPPMFTFTTIGKRNSLAASTAREAWLMTREAGYFSPSDSNNESCRALFVSMAVAAEPLMMRVPMRSKCVAKPAVWKMPCPCPRK